MDARFLCQTRSPVPSLPRQNRACKLKHRSPAFAFLTRTTDNNMAGLIEEKKASHPTDKLAGLTKKTVYSDSWLARLAINYLSQRFQDATGKDHATTVHVYKRIFCGLHNLLLCVASRALRGPGIRLQWKKRKECSSHKKVQALPFSIAIIIVVFIALGTLAIKTTPCRFLEETDCIGMCTNLCKVPSQTFIKHAFGMPVNMVPDFDDMSCEMIYGQEPPKITEDPAFKQPCYKLFFLRFFKNFHAVIGGLQMFMIDVKGTKYSNPGCFSQELTSSYVMIPRSSHSRLVSEEKGLESEGGPTTKIVSRLLYAVISVCLR
ncbi:hypothetical protein SADUNF_Sadunf02G0038900 [Salix dunnii]|uniref:Beta-carotene isomerase D27-like C-terminal domain-containing protein n=1 Tax=Salix dunnii TaxID=1413687 RepID=A0A835TG39_9ROSI|nr:hypothetical protein SADUNF_Sadunf02G0038900 [Salix dunnii]